MNERDVFNFKINGYLKFYFFNGWNSPLTERVEKMERAQPYRRKEDMKYILSWELLYWILIIPILIYTGGGTFNLRINA